MALNPAASYPSQVDSPTGAYPYGKARNVSAPGAGDGTPWIAPVVNDIWGMMQALLSAASITPSGVPDQVGASQYLTAMNALFNQSALASLIAPGLTQLSNDTSSGSNGLAATIGALNALRAIVLTGATTSNPGRVQLSDNPVSTSATEAATIGALNALRTVLQPATTGTSGGWRITLGKLKIQGGTTNVNSTTITINLPSPYTGVHAAFIPWMINDSSSSSSYNNQPVSGGVTGTGTGKIHSNGGQDNLCGWFSIGWDN